MLDLQPPGLNAFRALPKWAQWVVGVPLIVLCIAAGLYETVRPRAADEPLQAYWVTLILFIVALVVGELLRPKPNIEDARPASLNDFSLPTATEDRPVPLVFGTNKIDGPNLIWYGDLKTEAITESIKTNLFGSTKRYTKGYRYRLGMHFGICRGPNAVLKNVLIGDESVGGGTLSTDGASVSITLPEFFGGDDYGTGGLEYTGVWYTGSTTQAVNSYLDDPSREQVAAAVTPTAPRYSGTAHFVVHGITTFGRPAERGAYIGNVPQLKRWGFVVQRFPALFSGQSSGDNIINTDDCNPVNAVYELFTNDEWGFGFPSSDIDLTSFKAAADTMITEGNGFSMLIEQQMRAKDFLQEIQRQMDGVVFIDQRTGKWIIKLARADYDINTVPELDDDNVVEVRDFTRGSWEDTTNQIQVTFVKRADNYKPSNAIAQDMANSLIQGGGTVTSGTVVAAQVRYPGIKDAGTANTVAWRDLRAQSYPLARCTLLINREFWDLKLGDVVAFTNTKLGFTKLPMRITNIDYGRLQQNIIEIRVTQDIFEFAAASYGNPPSTGWSPPAVTLQAYAADEQSIIEAPRGIVVRDPLYGGDPTVAKLFCSARRQTAEVAYQITQRNASGTPSGSFAVDSEVLQFMRIGNLKTAMGAGQANPLSSLTIEASPDGQTDIVDAFTSGATAADLGVDLVNLILIDNEFMLVQSAAAGSGTDVDLTNVYRGALDSVQENHADTADVYLVAFGSALSDANYPNTNNIDVELLARSATTIFSGTPTRVSFQFDKRTIRPYPPSAPLYNGGSTAFATPDIEGDGGPGENTFEFDVDWWRRRYDTTDEVAELLADFTPDASTEYQVRVFVDPDGINTEIASSPFGWATGTGTIQVPRLELIELAAAGTEIRVEIEARHDIGSETNLRSRYDMIHDVVPTSVLTGLFYLGGNLRADDVSNSYTVATAGVHTVRIGAAYSTSDVEARINGGSWSVIITAGGTSGATASLSISDTIELRHRVNETPNPQFVEIEDSGATRVAYGTFSD